MPLISKAFPNQSATENTESYLDTFFAYLNIDPTIESLLIFVVIGIVAKSLILAGAKIYAGFTVAKIVKDLRIKLLNAVSTAEWKFFTDQPSGKLAASLMGEANKAGNAYITSLNILAIIVQIIAYLIVAFFVSWPIVILAAVSSALLLVLLKNFIDINKHLGKRNVLLSRQITMKLIDSTRSIKSLKAMGRETDASALLDSYTKKLKSNAKKLTVSKETLSALQEIFLTGAIVVGIYFSMYFLNLSIEAVIVLSILYIKSMKMVGKAQKSYQLFANNLAGFDGVMESISNAEQHYENRPGSGKYDLEGNIQLTDICFAYKDTPIFDCANATLYHNQLNTIVGLSGAGKTTLVDLISGLYIPSSGDIELDGIPLNDIDIHHWRSQIGYVVQENTLLNASIKENVTLGDEKYSDEAVQRALHKAHADSFIEPLPDGIYTLVGENGTKLSGGQRQRILIARALVHSPKLLILDEATSALDSETERSLSEIFKELSKEITIISISHRPALVEISDHIIELKDGKLREVTHETPLKKAQA